MSDDLDRTSSDGPTGQPNEDSAQPTDAANSGCMLKLVLIPISIVAISAAIWLVFGLIAHMGNEPRKLVQDLKKGEDTSWQKALTLANSLRNSEYEELKRDPKIAADLASVLQSELESAAMDAESVRLRACLCLALGEFEVPDVVPVLIQAVRLERDRAEVEVRRSALEAIAVLATNIGPEILREDHELADALLAVSKEQSEDAVEKRRRDDLRTTAAFTLGVIGGKRAIEQLELLLSDPYPNARYNAATGLARHGEIAAIPVLVEMLSPDNQFAVQTESSDEAKAWKRDLVVTNAIRAVKQLAERSPSADLGQLKDALEKVVGSSLKPTVRAEARQTLHALNSVQAR